MMFRKLGIAGAIAIAFALAMPAHAAFTGLQIQLHTTFTVSGVQRSVYRLYAGFSEGTDQLLLWGGSTDHAAVLRTCNSSIAAGTSFYNPTGGSNTAPTQAAINQTANVRWDTFATIGVNVADQGVPSDQTFLTPDFPTFINSNLWTTNIASAYAIPGAAQARADFAGDGDATLRVLVAQLTCRSTETIGGVIGLLTWRNGAGQSFMLNDLRLPTTAMSGYCCLSNGSCVITTPATCAAVHAGTFIGCAICADCALPCDADITDDGSVDIDDLLLVIKFWDTDEPQADIDLSGIVDIDDLLFLIKKWGPCQ